MRERRRPDSEVACQARLSDQCGRLRSDSPLLSRIDCPRWKRQQYQLFGRVSAEPRQRDTWIGHEPATGLNALHAFRQLVHQHHLHGLGRIRLERESWPGQVPLDISCLCFGGWLLRPGPGRYVERRLVRE